VIDPSPALPEVTQTYKSVRVPITGVALGPADSRQNNDAGTPNMLLQVRLDARNTARVGTWTVRFRQAN